MSGDYLTIRKWDEWQSYRKDRQQPPWIKLHRALMRDPNWIALSDSQRGQLVSIWMLAADRQGRIPSDPKLIQKLCFMDKPPDLKLLTAHGFLDATVTSPRRQPDANVTHQSRVEEIRGEESSAVALATKRGIQVPKDWSPSETTRSSLNARGFLNDFLDSELEKFRDYHASKGSVFKDLEAAFRTWMRNAREFAATRGGARPASGSAYEPRPAPRPYREIKAEREAKEQSQ